MESKIYRLMISLSGTKPLIWRRLETFGRTTLDELHHILQVAMGWHDRHLHQFYLPSGPFGSPDPYTWHPLENEESTRLDEILQKENDWLIYEYDPGDGWLHDLILEKVHPEEQAHGRYPRVTGGERACPPEDCGGVMGYEALLEVLANPDHPKHETLKKYFGGEIAPEVFDIRVANCMFHDD